MYAGGSVERTVVVPYEDSGGTQISDLNSWYW